MLTMRPHWRCFNAGRKRGAHEKYAVQIDCLYPSPVRERDFVERLIGKNAGAIYEDVAAAEAFVDLTCKRALTESSEDTSHLQASAWRAVCSTIFTVSPPGATSAMTMCAPSCASLCANACPMRFAPPEITAILSWWDLAMQPYYWWSDRLFDALPTDARPRQLAREIAYRTPFG
jgi:hypothetical protein